MEAADKSCELKICYFSLLAFPSPIISLNPFKKKKKKKRCPKPPQASIKNLEN